MDNKTLDEAVSSAIESPSQGKKNVIFDATVLSSLQACPRLTDFRFNHYFESIGGKSNSLEVGNIIHKYLETYYGLIINGMKKETAHNHGLIAAQLYINGCPYCTDFVPECYVVEPNEVPHTHNELCKAKPSCNHKVDEYPGVRNTPEESSGYLIGWKWALSTCEQYYEYYVNDFWVPLEVETVKSKLLYEDDEIRVMWKAKLDWLVDTNQGIYPVDHKTMKQRRDTLGLNNQFMGQSFVCNTRGTMVNKIGLQKTLKPAEKFDRVLVPYSAPVLLEWQSEIVPYYARLLLMYAETGHFPPNFASCETKYGKCSFVDVCAANPDMREETIRMQFRMGKPWNPSNSDED